MLGKLPKSWTETPDPGPDNWNMSWDSPNASKLQVCFCSQRRSPCPLIPSPEHDICVFPICFGDPLPEAISGFFFEKSKILRNDPGICCKSSPPQKSCGTAASTALRNGLETVFKVLQIYDFLRNPVFSKLGAMSIKLFKIKQRTFLLSLTDTYIMATCFSVPQGHFGGDPNRVL